VENLKTFISSLNNLQYLWDHVSIFALHEIPLPSSLSLVQIFFGSGNWVPKALMTSDIRILQLAPALDCLQESEGAMEAKYWHKKVSGVMKELHNVNKLFISLPGLRFVREGGLPDDMGLKDPLSGTDCSVGSIELMLPFCWPGARLPRHYHWVSSAPLFCAGSFCSSRAVSCWFPGGLSRLASHHPTQIQIDLVHPTLDT
jgi:hypothetical protein